MDAEEPGLFDAWTSAWKDICEFEVVPVLTSSEAAARTPGGA
jgi:hypothetical protein